VQIRQAQPKFVAQNNVKKQSRALKIVDPNTGNEVQTEVAQKEAQNIPKLNTNCEEFYPEHKKKATPDASPPQNCIVTPQSSTIESQ
jgi:hypothetical protein